MILIILVACFLIAPNTSAATTSNIATFTPEYDTSVKQANPTTSYTSSSTMSSDGDVAKKDQKQAFLEFNVTGITGTVQSISLRIKVQSGTGASVDQFSIKNIGSASLPTASRQLSGNYTWNTKPTVSSTSITTKTGFRASAVEEFIIPASFFKGNGHYAIAITDISGADGLNFYSVESNTASNRPQLVITTAAPTPTPVPTPTPLPSPSATPTPESLNSSPSSMYVYDYDNAVMDTNAREQVLSFAKANHITEIYLSADQYFITPSKQANLTSFITLAKNSYNIDTTLMFSNYDWSYTVNHNAALARTQAALSYISAIPTGSVKPIRIQYDVEPHATDTWSSDMQNVANQYLDFVSLIVEATNGIIPVQFTTANFYNGKLIARAGTTITKSFSQLIIDTLNSTGSIVVMNYRDDQAYNQVVSKSGVLSIQSYSNKVLGTSSSHNVTDDIAYASLPINQGKKVYQALNAHRKTAAEFGVTEANCASVLSLDANAFAAYGNACNSYWTYQASSFGEEGLAAMLSVGAALQTTYGNNSTYSAFGGWGVFAYKYFKQLN